MRGHRDTKVSQETIQRGQQVGTVHWMSGDMALAVKEGQLSSTEHWQHSNSSTADPVLFTAGGTDGCAVRS
jgi:hypothetical protein